MWLTGRGIPERFHEFVTAVLVSGNWKKTQTDEISLKRMARNISPGRDSDAAILKAYHRLKGASPEFFRWQDETGVTIIEREVQGHRRNIRYTFPDYAILLHLYSLPETMTQREIRAIVADSLKDHTLPVPIPRDRKAKTLEDKMKSEARKLKGLIDLASTKEEGVDILTMVFHEILDGETLNLLDKAFKVNNFTSKIRTF